MRINQVDLNNKEDIIFRFRNIEKVIQYGELSKLEMYFCPYEMEDDALEGILNVYWQGDEILWDNFFGHYLITFANTFIYLMLCDEEERKIPEKIQWRHFRAEYNMEGLIMDLLESPGVKMIKRFILTKEHPVRSEELKLYLNFLHHEVFQIVTKLFNPDLENRKKRGSDDDYIEAVKSTNWEEYEADGSFRMLNQIFAKQKSKLDNGHLTDWQRWISFEFPNDYFDILGEMIFPQWYVVSFCRNCTNTRNWAQYGDSNKGICLIYRTHASALGRGIKLKTCHSFSTASGKIYENHVEPLHKVQYSADRTEFNFFEMLGNMPGGIVEQWFHDSDGNVSEYYEKFQMNRNNTEWHKRYWELFYNHSIYKGEDWNGLDEERIVLEDSLCNDYNNDEERKIQYDFEELQGIIWGCNVKEREKEKIRKIIDELCLKHNRSDFEYYQAVRDSASLSIWIEREIIG